MSYVKCAIYDTATGQISRVLTGPEENVLASLGPGEASVPATFEMDGTHYVDNGQLLPFPSQPSAAHVWDWQAKEWRA